jgi:glucose/arabinose dehydrogenase
VPADNPAAGEAFYVSGVRNVQAFDWRDDGALVIADHGPSGSSGARVTTK